MKLCTDLGTAAAELRAIEPHAQSLDASRGGTGYLAAVAKRRHRLQQLKYGGSG